MGIPGVFAAEGEDWQRQRRLAVTALNSNHLRRYFDVVRTATERLQRRLTDAARDGRPFDIRPMLRSFTADVTTALAFGVDLNTPGCGNDQLQEHTRRVFQMLAWRSVAPVPYWRWVRLPADRTLDRSLAVLHRTVAGFIEQARARMSARPELFEAPENLLEAMLAAREDNGSFSEQEVIGNTLGFLLAGEDTTAYTMAWTICCIGSSPEVQAHWAREASEVLGERYSPDAYETVEQLRYGEAVLRESMRIKPVAPVIGVEPVAATTLAGTHIPAGTRLLLLTRLAGLSAVSRADEFDPYRWLKDGEQSEPAPGQASQSADTPDQKAFLPFGAGPRFCPGRNLAFLEAKTALAMIARNFELELDPSAGPVTETMIFTMIPKGLRVRLRQRAPLESIPVGSTRSGEWEPQSRARQPTTGLRLTRRRCARRFSAAWRAVPSASRCARRAERFRSPGRSMAPQSGQPPGALGALGVAAAIGWRSSRATGPSSRSARSPRCTSVRLAWRCIPPRRPPR